VNTTRIHDVIVVGAGVVGMTTALYLAREGLSVAVIDEQPGAGLSTSFANGGLVTPSTAMPWSSPTALKLLLRWIGREDAPLLMRPEAIPRLGLWGLKFAANCRPAAHLRSSKTLTHFARESLEELEGLIAQRMVDFPLGRGGLLAIYRDDAGLAARDRYVEFLHGLAIETRTLDADTTVAMEPSLAPIASSICGGLLLPNDAWGDAWRFSRAVEEASRKLDVACHFGTRLASLVVENGKISGLRTAETLMKAHHVVICAGPRTPALLEPLGIRVPIMPVKGYSISLSKSDIGFLPSRPIVDDLAHIGVTPLGDRLRIAGTVELAGHDGTIRPQRIDNLKRAVTALFPGMTMPSDLSPWAGLRPMTPDGLPVIDATAISGLYVNGGHGALGWTLACGSARLMTAIIMGREPADGSPFRLGRSFW